MKRIKRFLLGRKYHRLSINFVVISFSVTIIMVLCLHGSYDQVEPKSYTYFGGWQESNICNNSEKIPVSFFTTIRDKNFEMNLFIHDPAKDTVSKQLFEAAVLKDLDFAKVVKSFLDVFTDIDYVIDIGAHVGAITILSALMGKKVITIDGEKDNLKLMCSTLSYLGLQQNVVIIHEIAGISHTPVTWIHQTNGNYSGSYVDLEDETWIKTNGNPNFKIEGRSPILIDKLIEILPNLTSSNVFMNIDVNGYENMVLMGSNLFMKRTNIRGILINFKHHKKKYSGLDIVQMMKKVGLHPYRYIDNTLINLEKVKIREWPDQIMWI